MKIFGLYSKCIPNFYFEILSHHVVFGGLELIICRPGWPQIHRDHPVSASASQVLGLKMCTSLPSFRLLVAFQRDRSLFKYTPAIYEGSLGYILSNTWCFLVSSFTKGHILLSHYGFMWTSLINESSSQALFSICFHESSGDASISTHIMRFKSHLRNYCLTQVHKDFPPVKFSEEPLT
jgi:hypothetical protein